MNFKKILVPITLGAGSRATLAVAANLAEGSGASLVLLHVVDPNMTREEHGIPGAHLVNELCRDAKRQMRHLADSVRTPVPIEFVACEGCPADAIVQQARHLEASVVVMSTHGDCGWLLWLHRNTARQVLRCAPCPVWLLSPTKQGGFPDVDGLCHSQPMRGPS